MPRSIAAFRCTVVPHTFVALHNARAQLRLLAPAGVLCEAAAKAANLAMVLEFLVVTETLSLRSKKLLLNLESLCLVAYSGTLFLPVGVTPRSRMTNIFTFSFMTRSA